MTTEPLSIWAVSDGRAGIANQVLGLADAVARLTPAEVTIKRIRYAKAFDRWPSALKIFPELMVTSDSSPLGDPWPDIWIAAGRATIPHGVRLRRRSEDQTLIVQLQDPKTSHKPFDLIIAPEHDGLSGDTTMGLIGSTNTIVPEALDTGYAIWRQRIEKFPRPYITVLIGGRSKTQNLSLERAHDLVRELKATVAETGGSLLLSMSRRTPDDAREVLQKGLKDTPGIIFGGLGENPYYAFLRAADHILVTEDSVNMVTEAATTGKPVHIIAMDHTSLNSGQKFVKFHESLQTRGITRPYSGHLDTWTYAPLNETERAAKAVLAVYHRKYGL